MKFFTKIIQLAFFLLISFNSVSEPIDIESSEMDVIENGNTILADNSRIKIPVDNLEIISNKAKYEKIKNILTFRNDVFFNDKNNNITIEGNFIKYERKKDLIYSKGETELNFEKMYKINSENLYYDRVLKKFIQKRDIN